MRSINSFFKGALAALASGGLLYAGTGLHPVWWLTWLAPIPVLFYAARSGAGAAAAAAFAAWLLGGINEFGYTHGVIGLPLPVVAGLLVLPAIAFCACVLLWRFCARRGAVWQAALALPCAWVACEFLNASLSPHSTFGSIAYSQMDFLPVIQIASLTGLWGVVFILLLAPSAVAALSAPAGSRAAKTATGVAAALILAAVLGFGQWRLNSDIHATGTVKVALVSSDARGDRWAKDEQQAIALLNRYAAAAGSVRGAQIIVLPEDIGPVPRSAATEARQILSAAAVRSGATLVAGLREGQAPPLLNEALVFLPGGALAATYEKHHLIPGIEDGIVVGTHATILPGPAGVEGVQICKDLDFPALSREYGNRGVGLLLVPAWDFTVDGWLHGRMAILRGVESGFSIARTARFGRLTVSDNRGRILADLTGSPAGFVIARADVPVAHEDTLYDRLGDWFPWAALVLLALALGSALFRRMVPARAGGVAVVHA